MNRSHGAIRYLHLLAQGRDIMTELGNSFSLQGSRRCKGNECSRFGTFCCTMTINKNTSKTWKYFRVGNCQATAEDFILSDRQSHDASFILRCRDGSGPLGQLSTTGQQLPQSSPADPSSTVIFADATCATASFLNQWKNSTVGQDILIGRNFWISATERCGAWGV